MATSNTFTFNPPIGTLTLNAFARCGVRHTVGVVKDFVYFSETSDPMKEWAYTVRQDRKPLGHVPSYERVRNLRPKIVSMIRQNSLTKTSSTARGHILYVAINITNNKLYVGKTSGSFEGRKKSHISSALKHGSTSIFHKALRKHGPENFEWHVYLFAPSKERLIDAEQSLIAAILPEYNMTAGGEGIPGSKRPIGTWVAKRQANGNYKPMLGKKHSVETRLKISENRRGKPCKAKTPETLAKRVVSAHRMTEKLARPVYCLTTGRAFAHPPAAARYYGVSRNSVYRSAESGRAKKGLLFSFVTVDEFGHANY